MTLGVLALALVCAERIAEQSYKHAAGRHHERYIAPFQQQVQDVQRDGVAQVDAGLRELQNMPDPAAKGINMKNLDAEAAQSQQEMNTILKQDTAPPKPWVDHTDETIAQSQLQVANTIKKLETDFYSSLAQGSDATSLLEDGSPTGKGQDSLMETASGTFMTAAERRAMALNQEVQRATANFDQ